MYICILYIYTILHSKIIPFSSKNPWKQISTFLTLTKTFFIVKYMLLLGQITMCHAKISLFHVFPCKIHEKKSKTWYMSPFSVNKNPPVFFHLQKRNGIFFGPKKNRWKNRRFPKGELGELQATGSSWRPPVRCRQPPPCASCP